MNDDVLLPRKSGVCFKLTGANFSITVFNSRYSCAMLLLSFALLLRVQKGSVPSSILWMMSGGCMMAAYACASPYVTKYRCMFVNLY